MWVEHKLIVPDVSESLTERPQVWVGEGSECTSLGSGDSVGLPIEVDLVGDATHRDTNI